MDFYTDPYIGNPALYNTENKFESNLHYKSFFGPYSELKVLHGNISSLNKKNHFLSLRFQTEQEGPYFQRNRLQFVYGYELQLKEKWKVGMAAYFGGLFYNYVSTSTFQGGQDQAIDLGLGLRLTNKELQIGLAANQINQADIQPLDYQFKIKSFLEFYIRNKFDLSSDLSLVASGKYRYTQYQKDRLTHLFVYISGYQERINLGFHYLLDYGLSPTFSVKIPYSENQKQQLQLTFSFFLFGTGQASTLLNNQYEFSLKWALKQ